MSTAFTLIDTFIGMTFNSVLRIIGYHSLIANTWKENRVLSWRYRWKEHSQLSVFFPRFPSGLYIYREKPLIFIFRFTVLYKLCKPLSWHSSLSRRYILSAYLPHFMGIVFSSLICVSEREREKERTKKDANGRSAKNVYNNKIVETSVQLE